jgi:hypothetical protein
MARIKGTNRRGVIIFSSEEKQQLQAQAARAGITVAQQVRLLLLRGLEVVDEEGETVIVRANLDGLDEPEQEDGA